MYICSIYLSIGSLPRAATPSSRLRTTTAPFSTTQIVSPGHDSMNHTTSTARLAYFADPRRGDRTVAEPFLVVRWKALILWTARRIRPLVCPLRNRGLRRRFSSPSESGPPSERARITGWRGHTSPRLRHNPSTINPGPEKLKRVNPFIFISFFRSEICIRTTCHASKGNSPLPLIILLCGVVRNLFEFVSNRAIQE